MRKPRGYWTKERCQEEALKYSSTTKFKNGSSSAYNTSYKNKWLDEICLHMIVKQKPSGYWTKERCQEEALKYNNRTDFKKNSGSAYKSSKNNNWLDELCSHMILKQKPSGYWTKERCQKESLKYNNRTDFQKNEFSAYDKCLKNGWLDELCSHMKEKKKPSGYWTKERCQEEALKYNTRYDFFINNYGAYNRSHKSKWLDEICSHMIIQNNNIKRCIYSYEFSDNYVYVGLTYNLKKRHYERMCNNSDPVYNHIKKTNLVPKKIQLTNYVITKDAIKLEKRYLDYYKKNNWNILNKSKTGAIGGKLYWTKERCQEEALKYKSRYQFAKKSKGSYTSSLKNNWLDEICSHMIKTQKPTGYWTKERCQKESLKYNNRTSFLKNSNGAYNKSYRMGWLDEVCGHMKQLRKPKNKIN